MDALIYTAMSGAGRVLKAQQIHANNLANAETGGFRADIEASQAQAVPGYGYDARHLAVLGQSAVDARAGAVTATGRELDVALQGEGFLAVQGADGKETYSRAGHLVIEQDGALTLNGRPVLGDGGAITVPPGFERIAIAADGTLSIQPPGETALQPVDKLKLVRPAPQELAKNENGLLVSRLSASLPPDETVRVQAGHLERSNVSAVEEMVAVMTLNRSFEMQMKLYGTASDLAEAGNRLLRG